MTGNRMIPRSVLFVLMLYFIVIIITYSIKSGTIDIRSNFFNLSLYQLNDNSTHCHIPSPLLVYMYDLPPKFNVGMLDRRLVNDTLVTSQNLPQWPKDSGLMKQHSVEYWMMASLLYEDNNGTDANREAIRVLDPESADVFFVPFFSSVSVSVHGRNMIDPETEVDRKLQVDMLKFLSESSYWQRSSGQDHVIPMHHPNAFRFLREEVNTSILVVVDFGRYPKTMANLTKDIVAPYVHVVDSFIDDDPPDPYQSRTTLLFFRGRTLRKDDGKIRAKLVKVFEGYEDVHYEQSFASSDGIKASTEGMRLSKFCLDPAGDTPSSCRLFDAIVSHCVPVIVSDKIELPFEDEIDYSDFSIFFSFEEALTPGYVVKQLRQFSKEKWLEMWKRLKNVSHHYEFQYPPKKEDGVNMIWRQVKHKLSAAKLSIHRNRRLKTPDWWR